MMYGMLLSGIALCVVGVSGPKVVPTRLDLALRIVFVVGGVLMCSVAITKILRA